MFFKIFHNISPDYLFTYLFINHLLTGWPTQQTTLIWSCISLEYHLCISIVPVLRKNYSHVMTPNPGIREIANPITQVCAVNCSRNTGNNTPKLFIMPVSKNVATEAPIHMIQDHPLSFSMFLAVSVSKCWRKENEMSNPGHLKLVYNLNLQPKYSLLQPWK